MTVRTLAQNNDWPASILCSVILHWQNYWPIMCFNLGFALQSFVKCLKGCFLTTKTLYHLISLRDLNLDVFSTLFTSSYLSRKTALKLIIEPSFDSWHFLHSAEFRLAIGVNKRCIDQHLLLLNLDRAGFRRFDD